MSTPARDLATPYHRLAGLRPEWSRWWRPLLTVIAVLIAYTLLASLLMIGSVLALTAVGSPASIGQVLGDPTSPLDVFLQGAFAALLIPSALIGVRLGAWRPTSLLVSVSGCFRGELLRRTTLPVLLVLALAAAVPLLTGGLRIDPGLSAGRMLAVIVLAALLAPLQAAGEELAFRGVGQQAIGTWLRHPAWAIVLPVPFALIGRGYDAPELATAVVLGLACGFLAWKTGGLELPMLLHGGVVLTTAIAALLGGPASPQGPMMIIAVVGIALVLSRATNAREALSPVEAVTRSAGAPVPAAVRV